MGDVDVYSGHRKRLKWSALQQALTAIAVEYSILREPWIRSVSSGLRC